MINLRRTYLIASLLWALVLGPAVALGAFAFGAGISWLYLFGDEPWPRAVEWMLPLFALSAGLIAAAVAIWRGYSHSRQFPNSGVAYTERRRANLLLIAPIALLAVVALSIWARIDNYQDKMNFATAREARFVEFIAANQRIDSLRVEYDDDQDLRAVIGFTGRREGLYRLAWHVLPSSFDDAVIADSRELELSGETSQDEIRFSLNELASGYREEILNGGTGVLVDEPFEFVASLEPVLSAEEIADFPPGEQRRVGTSDSPLASFASASFPVSFTIP